ncbi:MAG: MFS transporter [Candidatus Micrarchaeota archaeon]|nr:MFS transporter [Candidatus Micrarchaeota archaeon]
MQKELKILLSSSGLFMLAGGLFGPIYAVFVENIGGDLLTAGAAYSAFAVAAGIMIFLLGRVEDRSRYQEIFVIAGFSINCTGYLGYIFVSNPFQLFIVQIIFGIGEAISTPAFDGLYSKHLDKGKYASEWGIWESMQWILTAIAAGAGGFIASAYGFRILFIMMLLLSIAGLVVSSLLLHRRKKKYFHFISTEHIL